MNKKIILSILAMYLTITTANAVDRVHVEAAEEFSTTNPIQRIDLIVTDGTLLGNYNLKPGDVLHCEVVKVTNAKRGKRNASFTVCPDSITSGGNIVSIPKEYYGKYTTKILSKEELKNVDKKKLGKKAVKSVGNHFVKGVAPVASLAEGVIKNESGNRVQSGLKQVYKDSALSYAEKGKELDIKPGEQFYLKFKSQKDKSEEEIGNDNDTADENIE